MPQTLLLADDSVTIQRVIELTFADEDILVRAVSDGDQAIERIDAEPPDIVLVDVGMPGRSGYEVAQHIKESSRLQHIPVLLLTGAFEPVDAAKAAAIGCDGVLAKPFEPQMVIARVKELLGQPARDEPSADLWATTAAAASAPTPAQVARLDSYFAELDEAFATLTPPPVEHLEIVEPAPVETAATVESVLGAVSEASDHAGTVDPVESPASPGSLVAPSGLLAHPLPDLPLTVEAAMPAVEPVSKAVALPPAPRPVPAPVAKAAEAPPTYVPSYALPPLVDAFAALLAAEQHEPTPATAPAWPTPPDPSTKGVPAVAALGAMHGVHTVQAPATISEQAVDDITERVLVRLSDQIVRETVARLVSEVAERLVREEIERIKASIQ